jgi:hypothetical protein
MTHKGFRINKLWIISSWDVARGIFGGELRETAGSAAGAERWARLGPS